MISVVIPCLNEAQFIDSTLQRLLDQMDPREPWEVLVADGMSDDGARELLVQWQDVHVQFSWVDSPQRATPHALNAGIAA
jgi:glycosyltransferase involved in cell wall biosynthesis